MSEYEHNETAKSHAFEIGYQMGLEHGRACNGVEETEKTALHNLILQMHDALQDFCETHQSDNCPLWSDDIRNCGKQCKLRDIEDRMRSFGIEVKE